jgi:hypothetical protein
MAAWLRWIATSTTTPGPANLAKIESIELKKWLNLVSKCQVWRFGGVGLFFPRKKKDCMLIALLQVRSIGRWSVKVDQSWEFVACRLLQVRWVWIKMTNQYQSGRLPQQNPLVFAPLVPHSAPILILEGSLSDSTGFVPNWGTV